MSKEDGGPAFPHSGKSLVGSANYNGKEWVEVFYPGMSLRDYFAARAMIPMIRDGATPSTIATSSYMLADAMLEARKK